MGSPPSDTSLLSDFDGMVVGTSPRSTQQPPFLGLGAWTKEDYERAANERLEEEVFERYKARTLQVKLKDGEDCVQVRYCASSSKILDMLCDLDAEREEDSPNPFDPPPSGQPQPQDLELDLPSLACSEWHTYRYFLERKALNPLCRTSYELSSAMKVGATLGDRVYMATVQTTITNSLGRSPVDDEAVRAIRTASCQLEAADLARQAFDERAGLHDIDLQQCLRAIIHSQVKTSIATTDKSRQDSKMASAEKAGLEARLDRLTQENGAMQSKLKAVEEERDQLQTAIRQYCGEEQISRQARKTALSKLFNATKSSSST